MDASVCAKCGQPFEPANLVLKMDGTMMLDGTWTFNNEVCPKCHFDLLLDNLESTISEVKKPSFKKTLKSWIGLVADITTILANFYNLADFLQSSPDTESQMIADTINIHVESIYLTVCHTDADVTKIDLDDIVEQTMKEINDMREESQEKLDPGIHINK